MPSIASLPLHRARQEAQRLRRRRASAACSLGAALMAGTFLPPWLSMPAVVLSGYAFGYFVQQVRDADATCRELADAANAASVAPGRPLPSASAVDMQRWLTTRDDA